VRTSSQFQVMKYADTEHQTLVRLQLWYVWVRMTWPC